MLRIGIPYRYIDQDILDYLQACGFKLGERNPRKFSVKCSSPRCVIYTVNSTMLPDLLEEGLIDLAILPSVDFREANTFTAPLAELDIPVGKLMLGVSKDLPIAPLKELPIKYILTRTPRLTKEFLERNRLKWKMRVLRGLTFSTFPLFGKEAGVVEYVRTGKTMADNGLVPIATVASSSVVLIAHPRKVHSPQVSRIKKMIVSAPLTGKPLLAANGQNAGAANAGEVLIYSQPVAPVVGK